MTTTQTLMIICLALAAILCTAISGCGGSEATAEPPPTKNQFVKRAKVICVHAETEQFNAGTAYMESHPGIEEEEAVVPAALPPIEKELQELKALGAPSGDEDKLDEFFGALENAIAETKKDPAAAMIRKGNPFNKPNDLAKSYGLEGCYGNP